MSESEYWSEKYRPKTLNDIIGSPSNIESIMDWANSFKGGKKPHFPGLLMSGPPGTGKTSVAIALSNDYDWPLSEFNASDIRTHDALMKTVTPVAMVSTLAGGIMRKLILLDEVDSLYTNGGRKDKGANKAINFILTHTKHPIVLTCNEIFDVPNDIKDMCVLVEWRKVREGTIRKVLLNILSKEGKTLNIDYVNSCIVKGDLRASINNLQMSSLSEMPIDASAQDIYNAFETVDHIFNCKNLSDLDGIIVRSELNPEQAILWISENVTTFYKGLEVVRAFEELSKADIFLRKARETADYHYWGMAIRHMTYGVALSRIRPISEKRSKINYPSYLKKMSATKYQRNVLWGKKGVLRKLGGFFHMSSHSFMFTTFPLFQKLCINDLKYLLQLKLLLGFNEKEVAMILDTKPIDPRVKRIMSPEYQFSPETEAIIKRQINKQKPISDFFR